MPFLLRHREQGPVDQNNLAEESARVWTTVGRDPGLGTHGIALHRARPRHRHRQTARPVFVCRTAPHSACCSSSTQHSPGFVATRALSKAGPFTNRCCFQISIQPRLTSLPLPVTVSSTAKLLCRSGAAAHGGAADYTSDGLCAARSAASIVHQCRWPVQPL